ncbi:MAG: (Fe-S)-binding protein [Rhodospirillales bacterium]
MQRNPPHVALFVTCLVDAWRPVIGFAAVKLLEDAGCRVTVPSQQTCCGQPAMNSGDKKDAKKVARSVIQTFAAFDYVVAPSGSCAGTISLHYPEMFQDEPEWLDRARQLAARTFELTSFLVDILGVALPPATVAGPVAYHDSCSSLREMGVSNQPRQLLSNGGGVALADLKEPEACCGFGGLFCVKYPEISEKMVQAKVDDIVGSGAGTVLGGDLGCLLNIAGRLSRQGHAVHVRHVAEVLAGMTEEAPPIGEAPRAR